MTPMRVATRFLTRVETALLVIFLGVMVVFAFAQVVMRNLFGTGLLWADPLVRQMVMWSGFIGAALAAGEDRHISIDALTKFLSPRVRHTAGVVTNLFAAGVCVVLAAAAWRFMLDEKEAGTSLVLSIPAWVGLAIIPLGYALLVLHFLLNMAENGYLVARPDKEDPPEPPPQGGTRTGLSGTGPVPAGPTEGL